MEQHYVEFYSPGTFFQESTRKDIDSWDVQKALGMANDIIERHNARPYAFRFLTRSRGPDDLDAKQTAMSNLYFFGCDVETYHDVERRNDPADETLLRNMKYNNIARIAVARKGWKTAIPIGDKDVVLD